MNKVQFLTKFANAANSIILDDLKVGGNIGILETSTAT